MRERYVDISAWQPEQINWSAYKQWAKTDYDRAGNVIGHNGTSHVAIRSSYGNGYTDAHFELYRTGALKAGIDVLIYYHYGYPQFNGAHHEADWMKKVVGVIREQDYVMLDIEELAPDLGHWCWRWCTEAGRNNEPEQVLVYASDDFIRNHLQYPGLEKFGLVLADWQFNPSEKPACPPPWTTYHFLQYTDSVSVPGIPAKVDGDVFIK